MSPHSGSSPHGLTIMFEHCTDQPYCPDSGAASGRSSPANSSSPSTPTDFFPHSPLDVAVASEDSWNLIPYDVPWGPEYYHYRAGTLPGPDGTCIFLRSPTPLKNRRTQKACNKCRQRKAKCSGSRPACTRCLARGYICEYVEEDKPEKRSSSHSLTRSRPREHRQREGSVCSSEAADASYSASDSESYHFTSKSEDPEPSTPGLLYTDADSTSPHTDYSSQWDDSHYPVASSYGYENAVDAYAESAAMHDYYVQPSYPVTDDTHVYHSQEASPVYHESPTFLSPEERIGAFVVSAEAHAQAQSMQGVHEMQAIQHNHNGMLINLAGPAEPAPQIALPQLPPMAPTEAALEEVPVAVQYTPQGMYYYPTEPALQYPYLQYQYSVPTYSPGGAQEGGIEPTMLYTMPMLSAGMMT
ncbi:hypothetical protein C8Q74DRAFT_1371277 [Fomes fomentarius]|nr:hypothetical protein C8Q74DRAFT_1371277 [Fomes fomentarius]